MAWITPRYSNLLNRIERFPGRVVATVLAVIALGIATLPLFSGEFIPALREGHYIVHMTAVPGPAEAESLRIGSRVAQAIGAIGGVQSVAQWVGRAPNGADTLGTHYSEFEVEIGALPGREQQRVLREIRETLGGERGGGFPGVTFAVNTFLTERIEETVTGFAAPLAVNLFGSSLDALDRDAQQVAAAIGQVRAADGRLLPLSDVADIELTTGRYKILHRSARRVQTVTANVEGRDVAEFERDVRERIASRVKLTSGN